MDIVNLLDKLTYNNTADLVTILMVMLGGSRDLLH